MLKNEILHHKILPGERLVDVQIADRLGVSRTPAREAIIRLIRSGLVKKQENGGYYVLLPSHRDIDEIYEIRRMIEQDASHIVIRALKAGNQEMEKKVLSWKNDYFSALQQQQPFSEADTKMHLGLIDMTENHRLVGLYQEYCNQMELFLLNTDEYETRIEKANEFHVNLIQSICSKDTAKADEVIAAHLALATAQAHELLNQY